MLNRQNVNGMREVSIMVHMKAAEAAETAEITVQENGDVNNQKVSHNMLRKKLLLGSFFYC